MINNLPSLRPVRSLSRALISILFLACILIPSAYAQSADDFMRSTGKIYVVVASLVIIFLLIIGYLIYLDRKIHKLEKQFTNGKIE